LSTDNDRLYTSALFGYLFVKKVIVSSILIASVAVGGWLYQDSDKAPCIEDWIAQTQSFLNSAASSIDNMPISSDQQLQTDQLDEKLQALLPSEDLDLSYIATTDSDQALVSNTNDELLPNLFQNTTDKSTSLSGQVHMDNDDNIIGAEVQVSIPTNL